MSDNRKLLPTPVGDYMQDEDGQGWTLIPGTEEHEYVPHHLTSEEAERVFGREIDAAKLRETIEALRAPLEELVRILHDWIADLVPVVCQAIQAQYKKPQRPDYDTRPKCCTCAKTKRDRKQRSRER